MNEGDTRSDAEKRLVDLVRLFNRPVVASFDWWRRIADADRAVSQQLSHGKMSPEVKEKILERFQKIDSWILQNCPTRFTRVLGGK